MYWKWFFIIICICFVFGPDYGDIRLSIIELPNFVVLEELFSFKCKLVNNCERSIDLTLSFEQSDGITWYGISGRKLETLQPHSVTILDFKAIPIVPGIRTISGIRLFDSFLKRTYNYDELGQVFVMVNDKTNDGKSI